MKKTLKIEVNGQEIQIQHHQYKAGHEVTVLVDAAKLDAAWRAGSTCDGQWISPADQGIDDRRARVAQYLASGKPLQASLILVDRKGGVVVRDGRHRLATLRDMGVKVVAVTVARSSLPKLQGMLVG